MKRIVILCDGTWNEPDSPHPTNVVRIARALSADTDGIAQIPIYIRGVGSGKGVTKVSGFLDKTLGGMFGWGLFENIVEAYRHLVFLYEPGDEVFIFGFSRGAFTARSLTGFIRSSGIVDRDCLHHLPEAVARYRTKNKDETHHPNAEESHEFRLRKSPGIATSPKEVAWREARGMAAPTLFRVAFLGVWDSVGALGVPKHLSIASHINRGKYTFHDANLSGMVQSARHAVALDEKRRSFEPTHWTNVDELNAESGADDPPYLEHFFAGDHGSVGGGGDLTHLSSIALSWMIEGAEKAGLVFDPHALARISEEHDPSGPLRNTTEEPSGIANWLMRLRPKDREGPKRTSDLHASVLTRWASSAYRPGSLAHMETQIAALIGDGPPDNTRIA